MTNGNEILNTRFIPTHVGNTSNGLFLFELLTVHPHACGEYPGVTEWMTWIFGSSPRMWGILFNEMQKITVC